MNDRTAQDAYEKASTAKEIADAVKLDHKRIEETHSLNYEHIKEEINRVTIDFKELEKTKKNDDYLIWQEIDLLKASINSFKLQINAAINDSANEIKSIINKRFWTSAVGIITILILALGGLYMINEDNSDKLHKALIERQG